jgi:hypothetical protein
VYFYVSIDSTLCDRKSLKTTRSGRKREDDRDPWEDQMRKDCAEKILLGQKNKKVHGGHLRKKPTQQTTVPELVQIAIDKGCTQTLEFNGFEIIIHRDLRNQSKHGR